MNSSLGVVRLVRFGHSPASPVRDGLNSELHRRCDATVVMQPEASTEWQAVRVEAGPYTDLMGLIVPIKHDRRIWFLREILGGKTRV